MQYIQPRISILGKAISIVQGQPKNSLSQLDLGGVVETTPWNSMSAYEADE